MGTQKVQVHGYDVVFEKTGTGYSCYAPSLPGCGSAGDTKTACRRNMGVAIELHLEGLAEDGIEPPARDGRGKPRPAARRGRSINISSRVSPETAKILDKISDEKGISKTEVIELAIGYYAKHG